MIERRGLMIGAALGFTAWSQVTAAQPADQALLATLMELEKASWQFVKDKNLPACRTIWPTMAC